MKTSFKQDCLNLLTDYRCTVYQLSADEFGLPYHLLPNRARLYIKEQARQYAQIRINKILEAK